MDVRSTVENAMGGFENLVKKIPGYSGYKDKERRREADALLRNHLAQQFEAQWGRLNELKSQMLTGPAMAQLNDVGRASRRLQTLIDKIKAAAEGYTGFFNAVKVQENQLDSLYEFDNKMLAQVDELTAVIDQVQTALDGEEGVAPAVKKLNQTVSGLLTLFDKRKDVITELYLV